MFSFQDYISVQIFVYCGVDLAYRLGQVKAAKLYSRRARVAAAAKTFHDKLYIYIADGTGGGKALPVHAGGHNDGGVDTGDVQKLVGGLGGGDALLLILGHGNGDAPVKLGALQYLVFLQF